MNMDTLTLWQAVADYRTRLAGFGFVVMICLGLPCHSYSQNQSAEGLADKLQGDINPQEFAGWFEAFKTRATPSELHDFLWQCQRRRPSFTYHRIYLSRMVAGVGIGFIEAGICLLHPGFDE